MAASTFIGQNFGAKNLKRAKQGVTQSIALSCAITAVLLTILILARRPLVRCFNSNEEVIEYAAYFLGVISPFYLVTSFNQIYAGALRRHRRFAHADDHHAVFFRSVPPGVSVYQ
jgi:Na+-driven multidrug efflux pump